MNEELFLQLYTVTVSIPLVVAAIVIIKELWRVR